MLVLLVEDEADLAELIEEYLETEGIECDFAYNGQMACELVEQNRYDVIVLDVMLPKMDGLSVCRHIRKLGVGTPVLMLTARDTLDDKLNGFDSGANDYLVKPFDLPELVARLKVLARHTMVAPKQLKIADLTINADTRVVTRAEQTLQLTPIGWKLLLKLAQSSPNVVSRSELEAFVWPDEEPNKAVLKTQLHRLRSVVDGPFDTALINTIKGVGVVLRA